MKLPRGTLTEVQKAFLCTEGFLLYILRQKGRIISKHFIVKSCKFFTLSSREILN